MSTNQEKRRLNLRDEVRRRIEAEAASKSLSDMRDVHDMVFGMLVDMIADLQGRVEDLERRLSYSTGAK